MTCRELTVRFGSAARAWDASHTLPGAGDALVSAESVLARLAECGGTLLVPGDDGYPTSLLHLPDPPARLFTIGDRDHLRAPCVAVVGTRSATPYGERVAREVAGALARAGATIVSGMARGIDAAAHHAALDAGGRTIAVLGTGIDVAYPAAHRALHATIARKGLLMSEELPGAHARAGSFPKRNRVIAALADVTIIIEAGARSGALITADIALDLGRTVAAVPGPIDSPQSTGANALVRDGAVVIATVADALALLGLASPRCTESPHANPSERAVWEALARGAADMDSLASAAALPARDCLAAVTALELAGAIECALTGEIRRR